MAVIFEDAFTEGSNTNLESHTPSPTGTSWTKVGTETMQVVASNDRMAASGTTTNSSNALYICAPEATYEDITLAVEMEAGHTLGATDDPWMMFARYTDVNNWYSAGSYQNGNTSNLRIFKNVAGTKTEIGSADFDLAANDIVEMEVAGAATATVVKIYVNGVERLASSSQNESSLTGKKYGFGLGNNWATATDDCNVSWQFDNFTATEFPPSGGTVDKTHTADALLKKVDNDKTHTSSAMLLQVQEKTHTTGALLKKAIDKTHTADALLKKLDNELSHTTDARLTSDAVSEIIFEDHFTRVSDANLEAHTPSTAGDSWAKVGAVTLSVIAASDKMRVATTTASAAALYTCSPVATERDIDVEVEIGGTEPTGTDDPFQLFARYADTNNWLAVSVYQTGGGTGGNNIRIVKNVGGTKSSIAIGSVTLPVGAVILMEVRGAETATIVRLLVNGTERLSIGPFNEPTLTGRGYGIGVGNNGTVATDDADSTWTFDNFKATQYQSTVEVSKAHTTNALTKKAMSKTHTTDADIRRQRIHLADAYLQGAQVVAFEDHFATATTVLLQDHVPDTEGTSWTKLGNEDIDINQLNDRIAMAGSTVASSNVLYRGLPDAATADQDISIRLKSSAGLTGSDDPFQLFGRFTDTNNWYSGGAYQNANTLNLRLFKCVAGVKTQIGSVDFDLAIEDVVTLRLRGAATQTKASLIVNGIERLASTDQNEPTLTGLGHGFGLGNNWGVLTDDANAAWIFDDYVVHEFSTAIQDTRAHTTGALIRKAFDKTHTANALVKRVDTRAHTTSAFRSTGTTKTHTTDSELFADVDPVTGLGPMGVPRAAYPVPLADVPNEHDQLHNTNALLRSTFTKTHTTNASVKKVNDKTHSTDGLLTGTPIRQHATNAILRGARTVAHTVSAFTAAITRTHTTDARTVLRNDLGHSTDARVIQPRERHHTADSLIVIPVQILATHTTSATLWIEKVQSHLTNSLLRQTPTLAHTVNALLEIVVELGHTTSAFLRRTSSPEHTTNALLKDTIDVAHTTTALLDDATSLHHGTDSTLAGTRTVTHATSAALIIPGTKTHTADALILKRGDRDFLADALLRTTPETSHGTSAHIRAEFDLDHETDAGVWWIKDLIHVADSLIIEPPGARHTADTNLRESTAQKTFLRGSFKNIVLKGSL